MSKMSDMAMTVEDLRKCATTINEAANWLSEMFRGDDTAQKTISAPVEPTLTLEEVRAILAEKSRTGYTAQIHSLLQKYGANKLSDVNSAEYPTLIKEVQALR